MINMSIGTITSHKTECKKFMLNECLDWQNSQFINIVGKDDVSAGFEVICMLSGFRGGFSHPIPSRSHSFFQQSTVKFTNPPAHPGIVAAVAA
jgi:hypothetical protein